MCSRWPSPYSARLGNGAATAPRDLRCAALFVATMHRLHPGLLLLCVLTACTVAPWRGQDPPWSAATVAGAEDARVVRRDGAEEQFAHPEIVDTERGPILRGLVDGSERCVLLADVAGLETRRTEALRVIANVAIAAVVVTGILVLSACSHGHSGGGCSISGLDLVPPPTLDFSGPREEPPPREPMLPSEHAATSSGPDHRGRRR